MNERQILFLCEGSEETCFADCLQSVKVFNEAYQITQFDCKGAGNVPLYFDQFFQNGNYDAIFPIVDVDMFKTNAYLHTVKSLEGTLGFDPRQLLLFTNPCTFQLFLASKGDDVLSGKSKTGISPFFAKYWNPNHQNPKPYGAHDYQLESIRQNFSRESYDNMMARLSKYSQKEKDCPSTSAYRLSKRLESPNTTWLNNIMDKKKG